MSIFATKLVSFRMETGLNFLASAMKMVFLDPQMSSVSRVPSKIMTYIVYDSVVINRRLVSVLLRLLVFVFWRSSELHLVADSH